MTFLLMMLAAVTFESAFKTGTAGSITYSEGGAVPRAQMQAEVQKVLDRAVAEGSQGAVQFCVYIDGECVVDAWAGTYATNSTRRIDGDSLFPIYSTEKQLLVTAAHRAHEQGLLDYDATVKSYWPEFTGASDKEALTMRELMGHRAGLPAGLSKSFTPEERTNWNHMVAWAAKQSAKDPGKVSRYLSGTFGVYLGHPLENLYKKPIKEILDEQVLVPAGIEKDFFFVSGPEEDMRTVTVYNSAEPWNFEKMNETAYRRAINPAGWAVSSARGIAKFYNRLCGFDGKAPLIRPETLDNALKANRWEGEPVTNEINDKWVMVWGLGYGLFGEDTNLARVFGQGGLGGSEGMCDREKKICIGYTCNISSNYDGFNKITPELFRIVGFGTRYTRAGKAERPAPGVKRARTSLQRVNLFVGTQGEGNTTPAAAYPFGMMNPGPDTSAPGQDTPCSGYRYSDTNLVGFSQQHLNGTGHPGLGDLRLFPFCGTVADWNDSRQHVLDHAKEEATPGYYALTLANVHAEMTATPSVGCLRFTRRPGTGTFRLLVDLDACLYHLNKGKIDWRVLTNEVRFAEANDALSGVATKKSWGTRTLGYAIAFDRPWTALEALPLEGERKTPPYVMTFDLKEGEALTVKTAISLRGGEVGARANLGDAKGWDFDGWRRAAEAAWERTLSLAKAEGGPDETLDMFYTSLYHCFTHPNLVSDVGRPERYTTFSLWDTYRTAHPLYTILTPEVVTAFLDSFLDQFEKNGYLPVWTLADEEINCMIANHSIPVIVDAWKKGLVKDPELLWRAVRATLRENHPKNPKENWPALDKYGYFPNDVFRREACSRTLEVAYNDWCAAEFAEGLGHKEDAAFFRRRAESWKKLYDPEEGLMNSRNAKGEWRRPFDPHSSGWGEGYDFTEGNAWQYSWHVFQDPEGLIATMGGRDAFAAKLARFFDPKHNRLSTGNVVWFKESEIIGQYWHGNEPCQHVPWFWQLVGQGERTDEIVREVFDRFYRLRPDGLSGNDDCGQMSAWYVFAAMGFYPFNPCGGEYVLSAPQVPRVEIKVKRLGEGEQRMFSVSARNWSRERKYVKSVKLNGRELKDRVLKHSDIMKGGELVFEMGRK